jgi:hypothetical protein
MTVFVGRPLFKPGYYRELGLVGAAALVMGVVLTLLS